MSPVGLGASHVGIFLAHALTLEAEAAERYDELADAMQTHNNKEVADMFRQMAKFSRMHKADVEKRAQGVAVPHMAPWDFQWNTPESPEAGQIEGTHYMMTAYHALILALHNEERGQAYYAGVATATKDPEVRRLAKEMAEEEAEHVATLKQWLNRYPKPAAGWDDDLDPPVSGD